MNSGISFHSDFTLSFYFKWGSLYIVIYCVIFICYMLYYLLKQKSTFEHVLLTAGILFPSNLFKIYKHSNFIIQHFVTYSKATYVPQTFNKVRS